MPNLVLNNLESSYNTVADFNKFDVTQLQGLSRLHKGFTNIGLTLGSK